MIKITAVVGIGRGVFIRRYESKLVCFVLFRHAICCANVRDNYYGIIVRFLIDNYTGGRGY